MYFQKRSQRFMEMFYQVLERKKKKKNRVSGIIRIYEVTKIKRDEL